MRQSGMLGIHTKSTSLLAVADLTKNKIHLVDETVKNEEGHAKSVLDNKENTYVLELLGKNYSAMIHE